AVEIEADGNYKIEKEWGEEPVCKLITPDGIIKKQDEIDRILTEIFGCGKGTYREILLSPQSSAADNLQRILSGSAETNKTLSEAVSQAFAESGGISVTKLEEQIQSSIETLAGTKPGWDLELDKPRKDYKTMKVEKYRGAVITALQARDEVEIKLEKLKENEKNLDDAIIDLREKDEALKNSENALSEFAEFAEKIRDNNHNKQIAERCESDLKRYSAALDEFPKANSALERARDLASERENRAVLDSYRNAEKLRGELRKIEEKLRPLTRPSDDEIKSLEAAERELPLLQSKLRGMNIAATLKTFGGNTVKITSLLTGEPIEISGETAVLTEAARIEIPGIMEMSLSPAEVDPEETNARISSLEAQTAAVFGKYGRNSAEEIKALAREFDELSRQRDILEADLKRSLGDRGFSELENAAKALGDTRGAQVIESDISALCGGADISKFIGAKENAITAFEREYSSVEALKALIEDRNGELEKVGNALRSCEDIPEKYRGISDVNAHKAALDKAVKAAREAKEQALADKIAAETTLCGFVEENGDDLQEQLEKRTAEYNERVDLLHKWLHIQEVFNAHKSALSANPLDDLARNFGDYLNVITGDRISAEFADGKSSFELASAGFRVDFPKLSDGTRDVIYLAFRLAVLEHLFPAGGGVLVLDDPLNNMDQRRFAQSCELIKKAAERHQIIFLTCREEYAGKLGGNLIKI
ncbi:MAG: hypothetical protein K2J77_07270, partial [Oscillospiraceae bacterium]|nr:hypothetical protein [Oscillospiraceae bacterium]